MYMHNAKVYTCNSKWHESDAAPDVLIWRVQLRATFGCRESFLAALQRAYAQQLLDDTTKSRLLRSHFKAVASRFPGAFLSQIKVRVRHSPTRSQVDLALLNFSVKCFDPTRSQAGRCIFNSIFCFLVADSTEIHRTNKQTVQTIQHAWAERGFDILRDMGERALTQRARNSSNQK